MNNPTLTDYLFHKAGRRHIPFSGTFEVSPLCNFDCRMCYVKQTPGDLARAERGLMSPRWWNSIARQARDAGMLYALITGGEPLLWEGFWDLYETMADLGVLVSVNTNGSLLDEEAVCRFRRRPPKRVNITLYGAGDDTYRRLCGPGQMFDRVDRNIRALRAAGIPVKIHCSLTPDNVHDLEAIVAYAREQELPLAATSYMFPPVRRDPSMAGQNNRFTPEEAARYRLRAMELQCSREHYLSYLEQLCRGNLEPPGLDEGCVDPLDGKIRCRAGTAAFWITWDGFMTPCGMMPEPRTDLSEGDFSAGWQELTRLAAQVRLSGACEGCANREICHPCGAMALAETGSLTGIPTYLCRMARQMQCIARDTLNQEK